MSKNIAVVGSSNSDLIIKAERIPKPGETIMGGKFYQAAGGKGANQAVAAARAGGNVNFIACIGNDVFGEEALKGFKKDNINTDHVFVDKDEASGTALILIDKNGENSIAVASGANLSLDEEKLLIAKEAIYNSSVLLMQLETPIETIESAASIASANGVQVILNPAPAHPLSDELLKNLTIITPNETEAEMLTGVPVNNLEGAQKAADFLLQKGVEIIIITLGIKGAFFATNNESQLVKGFTVEAQDTTAAGDTFNGTLAVAISEGKSLVEAIKFANAAAAISVTKIGAQPSAPMRDEIDKLYSQ
jgi:ribokinase